MKNNKTFKLVAIIALIAAMAFAFVTFREKPVEGSKAITIEVVDNNASRCHIDCFVMPLSPSFTDSTTGFLVLNSHNCVVGSY